MAQSVLIVPVPEAEPWVRELRERGDPVAALGMPAHVTVLFPFVPPELITQETLATIADALSSIRSFRFTLQRIDRFPETIYLAPEPAQPFIEITETLARAFPEYPPYTGQFTEIVPHLTVVDRSEPSSRTAQREIEAIVKARGPIHATASAVELFTDASGRWSRRHVFSLGSVSDSA